ncbi:hypothetical protein [Halalkalicoccus subterraneus]|uniref:hypothetical protein n=1 Tax=Halalkalicoccus subterraneus TaxID=2675002 RepID=UPI001FE4EBF1|nr:hypothetical protein [Halalkalicoccus subterraneus]
MGFSVSGSTVVILIGCLIAFSAAFTVATDSFDRTTTAQDDRADRLLDRQNTAIEIGDATRNGTTIVSVTNTGSTAFSIDRTDLLDDGNTTGNSTDSPDDGNTTDNSTDPLDDGNTTDNSTDSLDDENTTNDDGIFGDDPLDDGNTTDNSTDSPDDGNTTGNLTLIEPLGNATNETTVSVSVTNTGSTALSIDRTDLLVDGEYATDDPIVIDATGNVIDETNLWVPGATLAYELESNATSVKVVTEGGVAATAGVENASEGA